MDLSGLDTICESIRQQFDAKHEAREAGLRLARQVIANSANTIRAVHREQFEGARAALDEIRGLLDEAERALGSFADIFFAGFIQDAEKEYAEAELLYALVRRQPLPEPEALRVGYAPWLNGLGEAVGELRRWVLDRIRAGQFEWGEEALGAMDDIYYQLISFDYPGAISGNLRRTTDAIRGLIERTRGDLTNALRQEELTSALRRLEEGLTRRGTGD